MIVVRVVGGLHGFRFERHAALRAIAGMVLFDFRMHRAGVNGDGGGLPRGIAVESHTAFRTVAGFVGFHAGTHRAEVFRAGRGFYIGVVMMVSGMAAGLFLFRLRGLRFAAVTHGIDFRLNSGLR